MRIAAPLIGVYLLTATATGCARSPHRAPAPGAHDGATLAVYHETASRPAAALVFSPPLVQDTPPLELSRDLRQTGAFVGYPEGVAEYFYVRWDDRQEGGGASGSGGNGHNGSSSGFHDRYERRAVSEKTGVLYR